MLNRKSLAREREELLARIKQLEEERDLLRRVLDMPAARPIGEMEKR